jgi:LmbE family N-acetylglucosaminyl deacetylase
MSANQPGQPPVDEASSTSNLETPSSVLAIGAHPDDVEFGCGATLAKWAARGCVVHHLICTDGSKGTWDTQADLTELVLRRQEEQREAARRLTGTGAGEVRFLSVPDGELTSDPATVERVVRVIRELRPEAVLSHDPWKQYRLHPDHRAAGYLVCDAVVAARDPHFFPGQQLTHHRPRALMLWEAQVPAHVEDVSGFVDRKIDALEAHRSQFESTMHAVDEGQLEAFRARIRTDLTRLGAPFGFAAAEVFALVRDL